MTSEPQIGSDANLSQLVNGIVHDAQELITQQMSLLRSEVQEDMKKVRDAGLSLAAGLATCLVGGFLLCLMIVHLVSWGAPALPLWVCFALVGVPIAAVGVGLVLWARHSLQLSNLLPHQSAQALKENVRWLTNPK